jgi:hypothetical protein
MFNYFTVKGSCHDIANTTRDHINRRLGASGAGSFVRRSLFCVYKEGAAVLRQKGNTREEGH